MSYDGTIKFDTKMDTGGFQQSANRLGTSLKEWVFKLLSAGVNWYPHRWIRPWAALTPWAAVSWS